MTRYLVTHLTRFNYTEPVSLCHNMLHLVPRESDAVSCDRAELTISPEPSVIDNRKDSFGNPVTHFTIKEPHKELSILSSLELVVTERAFPRPGQSLPWDTLRDRMNWDRGPAWLSAVEFRYDSKYVPLEAIYSEYAAASFPTGRPILDACVDLTARIFDDFQYDPKSTTISTPVQEVFTTRRGVCQDFAHFQIACLRSLGLAARYVSGYLSTTPAPGKEKLVGADASHAWVSVFCGDDGWIDLDPTNNQLPRERHIPIAWGRDYDDVSPVKGVILGGGEHTLHVAVDAEVW